MPDRDCLQRLLFENPPIRGEFVRLDATWRTMLKRRARPPPARRMLDESQLRQSLAEGEASSVGRASCGYRHAFDSIDIAGLFAVADPVPPVIRR